MTLISYFWIRMTHISLLFEDEGPLSVMPEEHTVKSFPHVYGQPEINCWLLSVYVCDNLPTNHRILTELHQWFSIMVHNSTSKPRAWVVCWLRSPAHHEVELSGWNSHRKVRWTAIQCKGFISSIQQLQLRRNAATGSKPFLFHCEKGLRIFVVDPLYCVSEICMIIPLINNKWCRLQTLAKEEETLLV